MAQSDDYKELVDAPNETLEVEYKSWLDLADNEARADLARHIAAMANHGGGIIVFGFTDDLKFAGPNPHSGTTINRDVIASIVKKYLEPTFQCDVEIVTSGVGTTHPVVRIPSHGSTPICAKAGGPAPNGRPLGIVLGTYYTRKPGPESAPILSAVEWAPLIRRCALHERASILIAIEAALTGKSPPAAGRDPNELQKWHDAAFVRFKADVVSIGTRPELSERNVQYSYAILREDGQRLDPQLLRDTLLLQINSEVKDRVRTHWSMIYPFSRSEICPRFMIDEASGEGSDDFIESALLREPNRLEHHVDMWRVTTGGKVTLIRPYWEDASNWNQQLSREPGTWLSPDIQARAVAELVRHAQAFAEKFDFPVMVEFLCEWRGLLHRSIYDPDWYFSIGGEASANSRRTVKEVPSASLATSWPEIVSDLTAPVVRLFNSSFQVTPGWVQRRAPAWLR